MSKSEARGWRVIAAVGWGSATVVIVVLGSALARAAIAYAHPGTFYGPGDFMAAELAMPIPVIDFGMQRSWPVLVIAIATVAAAALTSWQFARTLRKFTGDLPSLVIAQLVCGLSLCTFAVTLSPDPSAYVIYGRLAGVYGVNPYTLPAQPQRLSADPQLTAALGVWGNPPPGDNYGPAWTLLAAALARLTVGASLSLAIVG